MFSATFASLVTGAIFIPSTLAGYVLSDDFTKDAFFGNFTPFTENDPTNGFVKYLDYNDAIQSGLMASVANYAGAAYMGVDNSSKPTEGRPSMRITSAKAYNKGLFIADIAHMPVGCGTWPAFWLVGPNWPAGGEVDILEGVNLQASNQMTVHTNAGCTISNTGMTGTVNTTNCDTNAQGQKKNAGCGVISNSKNNYGAGFNAIGGGIYATEWTSTAISIWFFPRSSIPSDITSLTPNPSGWGTPLAKFAGGCNIDQHFQNMNMVFDTTFCGQWAGADDVWAASSCSQMTSTCNAHVQLMPDAFTEAYWLVNGVRVYQQGQGKMRKRGVSADW